MNRDTRNLLIVLGVLVLIALVLPMFGWGILGGMMGWGMMRGVPGVTGGFGPIPFWVPILGMLSMLAFWGALIAGVVLLVRWLSGAPRRADADDALDLLRRRYAAGEITREEYEQMRRVLEQ